MRRNLFYLNLFYFSGIKCVTRLDLSDNNIDVEMGKAAVRYLESFRFWYIFSLWFDGLTGMATFDIICYVFF